MLKSKQKKPPVVRRPPSAGRMDDDDSEAPVFFADAPAEDDFTVKPNEGRRTLTEGDIMRNRRVAQFFNRVKPGLPIDADVPELRRDPTPLSALIEGVLTKLKIDASPWLDGLSRAWPTLVAPEVARAARPGKYADGILFVFVTSSVKLFDLRRTRLPDIERAVRAFPGGDRVRQVRLMVNAVPDGGGNRDQ